MKDLLQGVAVLVTRPQRDQAPLVHRIEALGGVALSQPGIALCGVDDSEPSLARLGAMGAEDLAIFTSPAAVAFGVQRLPVAHWPRDMQLLAPGTRTAKSLRAAGFARAQAPQSEGSEGILDLLAATDVAGRRVLVLGAVGGRRLLHSQLAARGARVEEITVYRRMCPALEAGLPERVRQYWEQLIVTVTSAEILANVVTLLRSEVSDSLTERPVCVASARIGGRATELGFRHVVVAAGASDQCMIEAVVALSNG